MSMFKNSVMNLTDYSVSQDNNLIKLNQNESPSDVPNAVKEAVVRRLLQQNWNRYPVLNPVHIAERLAMWQNMPRHMVLPAPGSNALIRAVMLSVLNAGDKVLTLSPTFSVYERVAAVAGARVVSVGFDDNFTVNSSQLIDAATQVQMVVLANPNNPTGTVVEREVVLEICRACPGLVVIDEAYAEYSGVTMKNDLENVDNLIVLRTFSKAFSAAGIRLGYAMGQPEIIRTMRKAMLPFSLNLLQLAAFEELLMVPEIFSQEIERVIAERERLMETLKGIPDIRVVPSWANFILLCFPYNHAFHIRQQLQERGVLVRYFDSPALQNCLRVSIGRPDENNVLVDNLLDILGGGRH